MLKPLLLTTSLILFPLAAMAQPAMPKMELIPYSEIPAGTYELEKSHASLTWKVNHMGLSNYTARFTRFDAKIELDPKDPTKSKLVATIDPTSIKTDYPDAEKKDFDKELSTNEEWFNAGKFPEIKFESTSIEKTGEKTGKIHGNLTFLGVTKPLTLDTTFNGAYAVRPFSSVPAAGFSATAKLKRSDWGFSKHIPMVGDEVTIAIEAEFQGK